MNMDELKSNDLTKREYFAALAMHAMLASPALLEAVTSFDINQGGAKTKVAKKAIEYADELLKQLEEQVNVEKID